MDQFEKSEQPNRAENLTTMPFGGMVRAKFRSAEVMSSKEKERLDCAESQVLMAKWACDPESFRKWVRGLAIEIAVEKGRVDANERPLFSRLFHFYVLGQRSQKTEKPAEINSVINYYED